MGLSFGKSVKDIPQRDSFKRICDDASEVVLQYLGIKDKLRFECVSKQFQKTIFRNQFKIELNSLVMRVKTDVWKYERLDFNHFESFLRKDSNITDIEFWDKFKNNKI